MNKDQIIKIKTLLFASLTSLKINIGGELAFSELFAIWELRYFKTWVYLYNKLRDLQNIQKAYILFLVSQIISDYVNQTSPQNLIRGWANILMAIIVTTFLCKILLKDQRYILYYFVGEIISLIFFGPDTYGVSIEDMEFFKFRLAPILNDSLLIIAYLLINRNQHYTKYVIVLFLIFGLFSLAYDARTNGAIRIFIALVLYFRSYLPKITGRKILITLTIAIVAFQLAFSTYVYLVLNRGFGGKHASGQLQRLENPYNPLSLLMTGRSETFVALTASLDKPIFGHGSWALDENGKYTLLLYKLHMMEDRFYEDRIISEKERYIPSHSVIVGAWMTSGLLGFLAMLYIITLVGKRLYNLLRFKHDRTSPYLPIYLHLLFTVFWTFCFSPLPKIKSTIPIMIAFIITSNAKLAHEKRSQKKRQLDQINAS